MRNLILKFFLCFIFIKSIGFSVNGQHLYFNHLTSKDGLTSSNTRVFEEDYQGFIWIGTESSLHRYDGNELIVYQHHPEDTTSLSNNFITSIFEDSYHNLWIGTINGGLTIYNRTYNNFKTFKHDPNDKKSISSNRIRTIYESKDNTLFVGMEEGGVDYFKLEENMANITKLETSKITLIPAKPESSTWVQSVVGEKDHNIFIGSNGSGLWKFNMLSKEVSPMLKDSVDNFIHHLLLDEKQRLWIGTWGRGLYIYDLNSKKLINHTASADPNTLNDDHIDTSVEDEDHNIWIGTDNGLSIVRHDSDPFQKEIFENHFHSDLEPNSILGNIIKGVFVDKSSRIWIGSYYGGVNVFDKSTHQFIPITSKSWNKGSISNNNVFAFAEDSKGTLWVGSDGGGIDQLIGGTDQLHQDKFRHIQIHGNLSDKPENKVKSMSIDSNDNLYIGYWRGGIIKLNTHDLSHEQFLASEIPENGPSANEILDVMVDHQDNLWIATFNGGINYFNSKTKKFKHYREISINKNSGDLDKIYSVFIDSENRVWASKSGGGLNLYDKDKDSFITIENDILKRNEDILHIYESHNKTLWLGTSGNGLISYNHQQNKSKQYSTAEGLPSRKIYSILEDDNGKIWLATANGLSVLDVKEETFTNYFDFDGLQSNEFNHNSSLKFSDGTLFFGGIKGFNAIKPNNISPIFSKPKLVLTKFWLDNLESPINDPNSPLQENIILTKRIKLSYNQNSFSLGFTSMNFSFSSNSEFAYKLEEFDNDWKYIGNDNKATFTNLDPGTYYLWVKASNRAGYWGQEKLMAEIIINKAFWQTYFFKIGLFFLLFSLIYLLYRYRLNFLIEQRQLLLKMVQERTNELTFKNEELLKQKNEISLMNNEILAQNEELTSQNDQIVTQREELINTQKQLKKVNNNLEKMVVERTEKLESTINDLNKLVLDLDRFVYSASHELSAPLRSIAGLVNISKVEKDNHRIQEYLDHIELSTQKMEAVIKSILNYSRNTHMDPDLEEIKLKPFVDEIIFELKSFSIHNKIIFNNCIKDECVLTTDIQRLKIILQNIIGNAIKYSDPNKSESYISIEFKKENDKNKIIVNDNGKGIKKDRIDKIFNMYYRGTAASQGSGLGLFIVKEMIQRLGGEILVTSKDGIGTTFTLIIG